MPTYIYTHINPHVSRAGKPQHKFLTIESPLTANCWRIYYSPSVTGLRSDSKITWSFLPPPHFAVNELSREDTTSFRILKCPAMGLRFCLSLQKLRIDVPLCCSLRGGASGLKQCLNDSQRPSPRDQQSQTFPRWLYYLTGCLVDRWLLCPAELKVCLSSSQSHTQNFISTREVSLGCFDGNFVNDRSRLNPEVCVPGWEQLALCSLPGDRDYFKMPFGSMVKKIICYFCRSPPLDMSG